MATKTNDPEHEFWREWLKAHKGEEAFIELDVPMSELTYLNLIDDLADNCKLSKTELRRRLKDGAIRLSEDGELFKMTSHHMWVKLPIVFKYGKKDWLRFVGSKVDT